MATISIPARFNGPPDSGHGGYSCGVLAALVDAPAVEVSLRAPPPLERELAVEEREEALAAFDGETLVAEARPAELVLDAPEPVSVADALAADARSEYRDEEGHWFNTCFACGPKREPGDGLRLFPGALPDDALYATVFRPGASVADADGLVLPEIVWAALDCPTSAPIADWDRKRPPSVLARLTGSIRAPLHAGEEYVSMAWGLGEDGRKRRSASALYDSDGQVVAESEALWIELRANPG
jgi:hypothetical protein